jgi:hypothetical protein
MKKLLLFGIAALFLATGEPVSAAGVDYVCGDTYSIIIEPKDRTIKTYGRMDVDSDGVHQTETTEFVPKGITIYNDTSGDKRTVKKLPRNKKGQVAVRGNVCRRINQ